MADIINSYDNTDELLKQFPVENPTPVKEGLEKNIQNRLLTGFANWNLGFDAWKEWGDILYTPDSLYNVHSVHLTLKEYQMAMFGTLRRADIQMGAFHNMVIADDWCAIRYDIATTPRSGGKTMPGTVMEFVNFKDYGPELGTRVVEGWAGTRGADYSALQHLQNEQEQAAQKDLETKVLTFVTPDVVDLSIKYPVVHPTSIEGVNGKAIQAAVLGAFDLYNQGPDKWSGSISEALTENFTAHFDDRDEDVQTYIANTKKETSEKKTKRLYFDSMLIRGDWAAIHYHTVSLNLADGTRVPGERMQFIRFEQKNGKALAAEMWTK
ncbi:MAG: nuclear transport factor 2 family protein [Lachnospiraceae bacterium]|jgi:hypothetical protein|nr:nuclear transport factor 2 family protein [Lachnospiraceae bacterium]MCH4029854.1 nuclear transport factor 2 family protein [Lachnospiraceae bacterium]MCH4071325.1 nuclear transport factor 2 family protein [Lachnospiraceae bacterium]MCH4109371.1 nuclear transport factor 2 family protein [Lachnospiraceae bacterium]MCI1303132.1 nuclear transport factor 2 family protein [Lachnospiraceae bacterium]